MTNEIILAGCAPAPLAHYLKALGILRLVAEQADPSAAGCWRDEQFVLRTALDKEGLSRFLLQDYRPTPIVAPWNGGSGFYPKDNQAGIESIAKSQAGRLGRFREAIIFGREAVKRAGLGESPKNEEKAAFLAAFRAEAPEPVLDWMDAAILLAGDEPRYPPLLGTGGNDGRLDFTNNFMQRLKELIEAADGAPTPSGQAWLPAALFGSTVPQLASAAIGQFHPGGAGGPNASTGFVADSLVNPWDFVLMLEGALLFAATVTRRLEISAPGTLAYPFTVRTSGSGGGNASLGDEAQARAEIWLPLWEKPAGQGEIQALLSEGRATLGRRPAKDGLDFVRAVAGLGVDRGIGAFQRYGFLMRSGKAYLATPLGRIPVKRNPDADLISELEQNGFLDRLRRFARGDQAPGRIQSLVRQLEDRLFDLARQADRHTLQAVLMLLGRLSQALAASGKARDAVPPVPNLSAAWALRADDGSPEFRCAAALAGLGAASLPMRLFTAPQRFGKGRWEWDKESRSAVWGTGALMPNLVQMNRRRLLDAAKLEMGDKPFHGSFGAETGDVAAFLAGQTDHERLADLFLGLVHVRIPKEFPVQLGERAVLPAPYAVLKPFFVPDGMLRRLGLLPADGKLPLPPELPALLAAGETSRAQDIGWRRLRAAGLRLPRHPATPPAAWGMDGPRLLAALTIPLDFKSAASLLSRFATPIEETL